MFFRVFFSLTHPEIQTQSYDGVGCSKGSVLGKPFSADYEDISKVVSFIQSRLVACYLRLQKPDLALSHSHRSAMIADYGHWLSGDGEQTISKLIKLYWQRSLHPLIWNSLVFRTFLCSSDSGGQTHDHRLEQISFILTLSFKRNQGGNFFHKVLHRNCPVFTGWIDRPRTSLSRMFERGIFSSEEISQMDLLHRRKPITLSESTQQETLRETGCDEQAGNVELLFQNVSREGEKDLYRLARQRDRDGKDVQQVRVIKDRDGRVLTSEESVQRRWKEYFEELMNEENEREKRVEGVNSVEQKVDKIRKDEVRKALKRMKSGKAVGPDDIPVEVWKCLGEAAVEFLASLFNRVLESERMPEEWRRSVLVPIFKNKGDMQSCSNYRGIKLMSHTMKLWERVVEARLRKVVEICEQQYGFMPRKSTTDAIFALRILMEKYRDGQRELHCVFVDLEKAYDRVPREELWYCMRKSGVAEKYVRVVQDMYERSRTVVRCAVGQTEEFNVEVGLHQGSALSPFLFAIVMDQLSEEVRQESPWTMMFADDIVICSESREQVEENLERWRFALERRGMKVSRSKTEYMCVNEREGSGTVRLQGEEVKKVQEFKYLGSTVQSNGECWKEVKKRVQAGWNGWRKVSGVLCDRKISARIKGKVYRTVVRPAMLYGLETVSLRKRQEAELEVAELKMLRFSLGMTRLDRIRNEYIRGTAHVGRLGDKVREARLRWFGHVQRRESVCEQGNHQKHPSRTGTVHL
ncbi:hypothetical protein QTP70_013659 [Hemibagrus guttatus]|uniref:ribonuclease H n=1 Tax=Hemibagrus guttatus TaxID=175788 RepID=A0AAE0V2P3_9TELE|nr:hypothetical protein QTP70_013659 [Hemibagrus guttatus]